MLLTHSTVVTDYPVSPFRLWAPDSTQKTNVFFFVPITQAECLALNKRSGCMNWIELNRTELNEPGLLIQVQYNRAASFQWLAQRWGWNINITVNEFRSFYLNSRDSISLLPEVYSLAGKFIIYQQIRIMVMIVPVCLEPCSGASVVTWLQNNQVLWKAIL